jgi:hypothetical protein
VQQLGGEVAVGQPGQRIGSSGRSRHEPSEARRGRPDTVSHPATGKNP